MQGLIMAGDDISEAVSFEAFAVEALPRLVRFARWVSGGSDDAQDLVHDALVSTGARWSSVVRRGDPEWYVRRAIVNGHTDRFRRRRRELLVDAVPERAMPGHAERNEHVWSALGALPRQQRAVVTLRFLEDLSVADTARLLGTSEGTVKSHSARALASLRTRLSATDPDLAAGLHEVADEPLPSVARAAGPVLRDEVAARKRRTRFEAIGSVAVVCVLLFGGIVFARSPGQGTAPVVPATPSPLQSPTLAPTPAPTTTDDTTPSSTTGSSSSTALSGFKSVLSRKNSDGFVRTSSTGTWPMNPCGNDRGFATDGERVAFSATNWGVGDSTSFTGVGLYTSEAAAAAVITEYENLVAECGNSDAAVPTSGEPLSTWVIRARNDLGMDVVDRSRRLRYDYYDPGAAAVSLEQDAADVVLLKMGNAVLVVDAESPYGRAPDGTHPGEESVRDAAREEAANLAQFLNR